MRTIPRRPRDALLLILIALACTGGTFTCRGSSNDDKVVVDGRVNN